MSPFGPFYPLRLQASVNHAERLAGVLVAEEARTHDARHVASWLVGRASELERFVDAVVQQWRARLRDEDAAADAVNEYVASLHEGLAGRLGITGPPCCRTDAVTTETPPRRDDGKALIESIDQLLSNLTEHPARGKQARPSR
jgi:hypothetical protein